LDLSEFKTGKIKDMSGLFNQCNNLETSNVLSMNLMFNQCCGLKELNLLSFVTEKCSNFEDMFGDLTEKEIILENRDNCKNMISEILKN